MKLLKFIISYEHGISRMVEASTKVFLTCPECHHRYELYHSFCGMPLDVEFFFQNHKCSFCIRNGQDPHAILPSDFMDCPKCGYKCRTKDDIKEDIKEPSIKIIRGTRKKPVPSTIKYSLLRKCEVCGFNLGSEVHHKDWNHNNSNLENLQVLCRWCHVQAHKLGKPEFERMFAKIERDPSLKTALHKSAESFYASVKKDTD